MKELSLKYNPAFLSDEALVRTFVVRHRELATVLEVLDENTGGVNQHVLIVGPRGIGKSTLVHRVAAEIRRDPERSALWYPVAYGEESYLVTNVGEFWLEALLQVAEQTGESRWHAAHDDLQGERDAARLARRALAQLLDFADERGKRLLLVVENLNTLVGAQMGDDDAWALRRTLQTEPRLMLLGTATRRFDAIDDERQALYEFFRIIELDPLDSLDDIGRLWALAHEGETPRAYLRPVEILTGGNPRLVRILSEFAARTSFSELMTNLVHLMDEHTEYFKHHLDALAPTERKVFVALADRWDPSTARDLAGVTRMGVSAVSALLARLEQRGAVRVLDRRGRAKLYQVAERLYNIYHLMRRRGQASARVRAAVRFMVRYYEGERLLPAVHSLVREVCELAPEQRRDHYAAYKEVLDMAEPEVRARILAETREQIEALPDLPDDLRERLRATTEGDLPLSFEVIAALDVESISDLNTLSQIESELFRQYREAPEPQKLDVILSVEDRILALRSDHASTHYNRAVTLTKLGRHEEALGALDRALALQPDDPDILLNRGATLANLGRYEEALSAFDRALALEPDRADTLNNLGIALDSLGRHQEALGAFDRALALRPDHASTLLNRGTMLSGLGLYEEALDAYDRALALESDRIDIYNNKGVVLAGLGRYQEALSTFERALALEPSDTAVLTNQMLALTESGRLDEALSALNIYVELPGARDHLLTITHLAAALAARGLAGEVYRSLAASSLAPSVEPLLVALRMDLGEQVDVALEIQEVARDILSQIAALRAQPKEEAPDSTSAG